MKADVQFPFGRRFKLGGKSRFIGLALFGCLGHRHDEGRRLIAKLPALQVQENPPLELEGIKSIVLPVLTSALKVTVITPFAPIETEVTATPVMAVAKPADALDVGQMPLDEANSLTAVFSDVAKLNPSVTRARRVYSWYAGKATAASIPMIATTTISSISVKPLNFFEDELLKGAGIETPNCIAQQFPVFFRAAPGVAAEKRFDAQEKSRCNCTGFFPYHSGRSAAGCWTQVRYQSATSSAIPAETSGTARWGQQ